MARRRTSLLKRSYSDAARHAAGLLFQLLLVGLDRLDFRLGHRQLSGGHEGRQRVPQLLPVGREVALHLQGGADRRHRHEVGGGHPFLHVGQRRPDRLVGVLRLHRAHVEQQHDQTAPGQVLAARRFRCAGPCLRRLARAPVGLGPQRQRGGWGSARSNWGGHGRASLAATTSSKSNETIVWGWPSSSTSKSLAVSPRTTSPFASRTITSTTTSSTPARSGPGACRRAAAPTPSGRRKVRRRRPGATGASGRTSVGEPHVEPHGSHGPHRHHLAEGRRRDDGVYGCELHGIEQVVRDDD